MEKVSALVRRSLKASGVVGVGQTPLAEDSNEALAQLNYIIDEWKVKRWMVLGLQTVSFTGTGATTYSIGSGQTIDVARPVNIDSAYRRQLVLSGANQPDYPLEVLRSREDYNRICLKSMGTVPSVVYFEPTYPNGTVYVWPLPNSSWEIFLSIKRPILRFASLDDDFAVPEPYEPALFYNLTQRLRLVYRRPADAEVNRMAKSLRGAVAQANMEIPFAVLPAALPGQRTGYRYNIYSDGR